MTINGMTADSDRIVVIEAKDANLPFDLYQGHYGYVRCRTDSPYSSTSDLLIETPDQSVENIGEVNRTSQKYPLRSLLDLRDGKMYDSEPSSSRKRNDRGLTGSFDKVSREYSALSDEDTDDLDADEVPTRVVSANSDGSAVVNEARRSELSLLDGDSDIPTGIQLSSDDSLRRARIEHDRWTLSAQSAALKLADHAQASYKELLSGLEGDSHRSEANDDGINLEGPLNPIVRNNVLESAIKDLLKATLEAREAIETAEALALHSSHVVDRLEDVDNIQESLKKIEEKYKRLRNIDVTPSRPFPAPMVAENLNEGVAQLAMPRVAENDLPQPAKKKTRRGKRGGAKRRKIQEAIPGSVSLKIVRFEANSVELAQRTDVEATTQPAKLVVKVLVAYSLIWSTMMLLLPRYINTRRAYTLVGMHIVKDLCDLYHNRSWFWNSEASLIVSKVMVIHRIVSSQAFNLFMACGHPPSTAVYIIWLVPFGIDFLRGRHFDWVVSRPLNRLFFAKYYDRSIAPIQGPFPRKSTESPALTRLESFNFDPQSVLYSSLWNDLLKTACFVLLYITMFSHDSHVSKFLALMTATFLNSKGFSRPGIVEEGERALSIVKREHAFARSSGSVRRPSLTMSWTGTELCDIVAFLILDVLMIMGSIE